MNQITPEQLFQIIGLPDDAVVGKKATPIKKVIAQPDMVKTAALKKRQL